MSGSSASLNTDGFVGGIYHYLWQKIGGMSCPNVSIPDTVVFKYRQPAYWYFMSVDGSIKMKAQKNITNTNIYEAFRKQRADAVSDIVAYYLSPIEEDEERDVDEPRTSSSFDAVGLHTFLFTATRRTRASSCPAAAAGVAATAAWTSADKRELQQLAMASGKDRLEQILRSARSGRGVIGPVRPAHAMAKSLFDQVYSAVRLITSWIRCRETCGTGLYASTAAGSARTATC